MQFFILFFNVSHKCIKIHGIVLIRVRIKGSNVFVRYSIPSLHARNVAETREENRNSKRGGRWKHGVGAWFTMCFGLVRATCPATIRSSKEFPRKYPSRPLVNIVAAIFGYFYFRYVLENTRVVFKSRSIFLLILRTFKEIRTS